MSAGHISDGATAGSDGNKGVDVVIDFVDYNAAHAGVRWGVAAQTEIMENHCGRGNNSNRNTAGDVSSCNNGYKHNPYAGSMVT